jgi:HD-GYP domain-containing protein (c-di-GMP phosphodiesterase class II)
MLKFVCISLVTIGGAIMLYAIVSFYKSLVALRTQASEHKIFADWIYMAAMLLMVFFLVGYIAIDIVFINMSEFTTQHFIVAIVFAFGAVFVNIMVETVKRISGALSKKTREIIMTLVNTVEAKDKYTRGHSEHVANIVELIYNYLPNEIKKKINFSILMDAAILHDIGKIGISESILNKSGILTPEERLIIEEHPGIGKHILENTSYQSVAEILCYHHERIDGTGYYKLSAEQIPLESKIITVADTFSALSTDRVYRAKKTYEEAIRILMDVAGTQLDGEIVRIFCSIPKNEVETASVDST